MKRSHRQELFSSPEWARAWQRLGELATGQTTTLSRKRGLAIAEMVKGMRAMGPQYQRSFSDRFERDMCDAIDASDWPKFTRLALSFVEHVGGGMMLDAADRQRERHQHAGRLGAERRKGRPSPGAIRLADHERRTGVKVTKVTRELADQLSLSSSQVRRLRNRKP